MFSCIQSGSKKYFGTWQTSFRNATLTISKEGSNIIVFQENLNDMDGKYVAEIKNGKLYVIYPMMGSTPLTLSDDGNKLYFITDEFVRIQ